jgi:MFS family permease
MIIQSVLYISIFFLHGDLLNILLGVPNKDVVVYIAVFAMGNFLGTLALGWLFDKLGRKPMITSTYAITSILLCVTGLLFWFDSVEAWGLTIALSVVFFFASAGSSAAYLTISEVFPQEIRSRAIAIFFALAIALATPAPALFGMIIDISRQTHSKVYVLYGYASCALLMVTGALVAKLYAVKAEREPLETIAPPMSSVENVVVSKYKIEEQSQPNNLQMSGLEHHKRRVVGEPGR